MMSSKKIAQIIFALLLLIGMVLPGKANAGAQAPVRSGGDASSGVAILESPVWLGPSGGSAVILIADPTNSNVYYAGSWGAGVYKSTDVGVNWQFASQGIANLWINSMAIDPLNPAIIYAGTFGSGVYKSVDGGKTWLAAGFAGGTNSSIAIDPNDAQHVYFGTTLRGGVRIRVR